MLHLVKMEWNAVPVVEDFCQPVESARVRGGVFLPHDNLRRFPHDIAQ
jgi:hypothetical protein